MPSKALPLIRVGGALCVEREAGKANPPKSRVAPLNTPRSLRARCISPRDMILQLEFFEQTARAWPRRRDAPIRKRG
ncbi:hypothetical protein ABIB56_000401 [Glaciihabitans sp. UYNi722]